MKGRSRQLASTGLEKRLLMGGPFKASVPFLVSDCLLAVAMPSPSLKVNHLEALKPTALIGSPRGTTKTSNK